MAARHGSANRQHVGVGSVAEVYPGRAGQIEKSPAQALIDSPRRPPAVAEALSYWEGPEHKNAATGALCVTEGISAGHRSARWPY